MVLCGTKTDYNVGNCVVASFRLKATQFVIIQTEGLRVKDTHNEMLAEFMVVCLCIYNSCEDVRNLIESKAKFSDLFVNRTEAVIIVISIDTHISWGKF
jgi:hypothetical protein